MSVETPPDSGSKEPHANDPEPPGAEPPDAESASAAPKGPTRPTHGKNPVEPEAPGMRDMAKKLALLAIPFLLLYLVLAAKSRGPVRFERGVELVSVTAPQMVAPGATMPIEMRFSAPQAIKPDDAVFLHIEAQGPNAERNCRIVFDRPAPDALHRAWAGPTPVVHHLDVPVPASCQPGEFRIYTGLWNIASGERYRLLDPETLDERLHVGDLEILAGEGVGEGRTRDGSAVKLDAKLALFMPFAPWLLGALAAAVVSVLVARRVREKEDLDAPKPLRIAAVVIPAIALILGILVVLEFVKDDAYISFRYAHNFVKGKGLVFNPGEKLEGYTNFLWTMLMVPFEALGWDLFQVCEFLGTGISIVVIWQMTDLAIRFDQGRKDLSFAWGACWLATSSSWVLWAKSGLEQCLAGMLPLVGAALLWKAQEETEEKLRDKRALIAGAVMALACMTRPDLHLIAAIAGAPFVVELVRTRKLPRVGVLYAGALVAVLVPFHAWRWFYYHSMFPNTFYVKTGAGSMIWRAGLDQLRDMFKFNNFGLMIPLVPFAFLTRKRLEQKLVALAISLAFMGYMVKVGVDEMQWYRLYLPALPFFLLLAGLGARNLLDLAASLFEKGISSKDEGEGAKWLVAAAGWAAVVWAGSQSFQFTYRELHGFDGHGDLSGMYHPDLGKFVVRHERPGGLVAFQDMGSTPYHAPDVDFLDFIGLTDGTVARARHAHGLHAFVPTEAGGERKKYDAEMRDYYFKRNPEWAILTVYTPRDQENLIAQRFDADPGPNAIGNAYHNNSYQFGIWGDPRFHQNYVHVRTWQRSRGYYLSLFRRKDLWDQTPKEVVLDAPPADLTGPKATFERGIELLGGKVDPEALERHEVFITTWWKLPGALEKDIVIFVHVNRPGFQAPLDHTPGDWMYPADRWKQGEILEDRVLFQLPLHMRPGKYDVHLGFYRRSTGQRIKILSGPNDGTDRLNVGSFEVKPLRPVIHQLIPPTKVEIMRKYPERIVDNKRVPGT